MTRILPGSAALLCALTLGACDAAPPTSHSPGLAPDGTDAGRPDGDDADPMHSGTADDPGDDSDPKFDVGAAPDAGMTAPDECTKVDVLFMIDNSGSMANEQANLIAAFPGFVAGMQGALEHAESYHVGIVTSDDYDQNNSDCDELGDLVQRCGDHASGYRWFDDTEPDLAATFACEASVGIDGDSDERQVKAVLRAVEPDRNAPGECNDGFIRDDALLVAVLITDEQDGSSGDPEGWHYQLVAHKGGIEDNIVVLSLIGRPGSDCADTAGGIANFTERFTNHALGEICAGGYDAFFTEAISQIDTACQGFMPPG